MAMSQQAPTRADLEEVDVSELIRLHGEVEKELKHRKEHFGQDYVNIRSMHELHKIEDFLNG